MYPVEKDLHTHHPARGLMPPGVRGVVAVVSGMIEIRTHLLCEGGAWQALREEELERRRVRSRNRGGGGSFRVKLFLPDALVSNPVDGLENLLCARSTPT